MFIRKIHENLSLAIMLGAVSRKDLNATPPYHHGVAY